MHEDVLGGESVAEQQLLQERDNLFAQFDQIDLSAVEQCGRLVATGLVGVGVARRRRRAVRVRAVDGIGDEAAEEGSLLTRPVLALIGRAHHSDRLDCVGRLIVLLKFSFFLFKIKSKVECFVF